MKNLNWRALACGAAMSLAAAMPAVAGVVDFEDVLPNLFGTGDTFASGGYQFATTGFFGQVDTAAGAFFGAPNGSDGQYYTGANDSSLTMTTGSTNLLRLAGFSFAYATPVPVNGGPFSAGMLVAMGIDDAGGAVQQTWDFGTNAANGQWDFMTLGVGSMGAVGVGLRSVTFLACLYDGMGGCTNPAGNQAQFAIDNIRDLPEPASLALVVAALGLIGVSRRKQQSI